MDGNFGQRQIRGGILTPCLKRKFKDNEIGFLPASTEKKDSVFMMQWVMHGHLLLPHT